MQLQQVDARQQQDVDEARTAIVAQTQEHLQLTEQLMKKATSATARLQLLEAEVMGYRQPSSSTRMLDEAVLDQCGMASPIMQAPLWLAIVTQIGMGMLILGNQFLDIVSL